LCKGKTNTCVRKKKIKKEDGGRWRKMERKKEQTNNQTPPLKGAPIECVALGVLPIPRPQFAAPGT